MANCTGTARTNYFQVKDEAAFRAWADKHRLEVITKDGLFGVLPGKMSEGGFNLADEESDDSLDICDEIAAHLADGSIAVVMESGHEAMRYVFGWTVAINSRGERVQLTLEDIYKMAEAKFGTRPTDAAY